MKKFFNTYWPYLLLVLMVVGAISLRTETAKVGFDRCWLAADPFLCQEMRDALRSRP